GGQGNIDAIHDAGRAVGCYISVGSSEDWRTDAKDFPSESLGNTMAGWEGETWIDINHWAVKDIMTRRVERAASMGCDAIEADNVITYEEENTGVSITEAQQLDYNRWFAQTVHDHGMLVGLKNGVDLLPNLVDDFDFAIVEECWKYQECQPWFDTFILAGKPVFNVEYTGMGHCSLANDLAFDSIVKHLNLDAAVCSCADSARNYECDTIF
ncbi:unnamed protein product, partial [Sphacelaria rigidula]